VVEDLQRLQSLGVNHIFFDMNRYHVPVDQQFRIMERLRKAVAYVQTSGNVKGEGERIDLASIDHVLHHDTHWAQMP
jgi:hypothetical protein